VRAVVSDRPKHPRPRPTEPEGPVNRSADRLRSGLSVAGAALLGVVLAAGPAFADHNPLAPQEGAEEHASMSTGQALLVFGVLPLSILLLLSALVWLPGMVRNTRYRPQRGWSAAPVWFAGPADPVAAVETAQVGTSVRGGASGDW
jgi:hypothetical protein